MNSFLYQNYFFIFFFFFFVTFLQGADNQDFVKS